MPPIVALSLCAVVVVWLCWTDKRRKVSAAIWLPVAWAFLLSSRPVSLWLGINARTADGVQDALIDKVLFTLLIMTGVVVVLRRRPNWTQLFRANRWLFLYFLYTAFSVLWADDPGTSAKRWFKNAGNVVMVLTVLTDLDAGAAVRAFLARWVYVVVPLSFIANRYFPTISRAYDIWTNNAGFVGIGLDKNTSGMVTFVAALSLLWLLLEAGRRYALMARYAVLLLVTAWLLVQYRSSTAVACVVIGSVTLVLTRIRFFLPHVKRLMKYAVGAAVAVLVLAVTGLGATLVKAGSELLGRDPTLHGRNEIWSKALKEDINPLIGSGFYSFWTEQRNIRLSDGYYYMLGEAHNGYIETYLNHGLIGLALLLAMLVASVQAAKRAVLEGDRFGPLRIALVLMILFYNISESAFDRLVPIWLGFLLVAVSVPRRRAFQPVFNSETNRKNTLSRPPLAVSAV